MAKDIGVLGALALVALVLCGCGKAPEPNPAPSALLAQEERSVSVPVPPVDTADTSAPAAVPQTSTVTEVASPAQTAPAGNEAVSEAVAPAAAESKPAQNPVSEGAAPPIPDKVARVGDMIITTEEFMRDLAQRAAQMSAEQDLQINPDDPDFRAEALQEMINARVLRWVASRATTVSEEDLNREYERGRRIVGSEEKFREYLKREGLDEAGLKALLRDRIAIEAYKKQKLDETAVTEEEIQALYNQWSAAGRFDRKDRTADIQHIGVHPMGAEPSDLAIAKTTVENARARIVAGESFDQLAVEISDDKDVARTKGLYPEVSADKLPSYIAERIFSQKPGEVSEPFEGGGAWHLLKVLSVNEPGEVTIEKARDQIRLYLLELKRREALAQAVEKAKYLMDIEIYKVELRPKEGPGSTDAPPPQLQPPPRPALIPPTDAQKAEPRENAAK